MASNPNLPRPVFRPLLTIAGLVVMALKRLFYRPGLTLLALAGIVLAVSLVSSAAFFAQAVDRVVLSQELKDFSKTTGRPPFSMRVYFFPYAETPLSLEEAERLTSHIGQTMASEISLPLKMSSLEVESGALMLQPVDAEDPATTSQLGSINVVYFEDVARHLDIVGDPLDDGRSDEITDVWIPTSFAEKAGVNVGDEFTIGMLFSQDRVKIRVRGIWEASDPTEPFWFSNPGLSLNDGFLVRRQDFIDRIQPLLPSKTRFAAWHILLDENEIVPDRAAGYITGIARAMVVVQKYLPKAKLDLSPLKPLESFALRSGTLTTLLLGFNVPAFGFLLYFLVLTSAIIARWQRRETAILVSRGMNLPSVLGMTFVEELLLFIVGAPLGLFLGTEVAQFMGQTVSFLSFASRSPLPVSLQGLNLPSLAITLTVAMVARLWPAAGAARLSTVESEREQARPVRPPFWQRYYFDFLLVLPTYYAYRQLAERGSLAMLVKDSPTDLYRDPLLILVPALFVLAGALLIMRLFPLLVGIMDRVASLVPWVTPHLALRQLGRQSQAYINPLLLIIVCLALGVYTFSLAASLDQWLADRMYYKVGADLSFKPAPLGADSSGSSSSSDSGEQWVLPIEEFQSLPGVAAATRVGDYGAKAKFSGQNTISGRLLGVDRLAFPSVAWFRDDFADDALGGLMNLLAIQPDGILLPEEVLTANNIRIGEQFPMSISIDQGLGFEATFTVVGTYKYFPTVYADQITAIGNLEYIFSFFGTPMSHNIWLRLQPGVKGSDVYEELKAMGIMATQAYDAQDLITEEQNKTERVGVFGTLTVGFLAAAIMALAGLLINTYASLNERLHRFTILHAIGLFRRQILAQVLLEYFFLTAYGAAAGAVVGAVTSSLFAPFFRITGAQEIALPPLIPVIAQDQIMRLAMAFGGVMIVLELAVIASALYQRFFNMLAPRSQG